MKLRNDSKLDYKSLPEEEGEKTKRIVEHLNSFIGDVARVLSNIDITNFASGQKKITTLRSDQEIIVAAQGYTVILLETSQPIETMQVNTKSTGVTVRAVTKDNLDASAIFWVFKL